MPLKGKGWDEADCGLIVFIVFMFCDTTEQINQENVNQKAVIPRSDLILFYMILSQKLI